ncbi:MAG: putative DNA binding domain-containing protein [Ignavibacteriales bacterium]|nr:putative DNA binding domain-containing protein [Ignavibacteriales bacterium]
MIVDKVLVEIEDCILTNQYRRIESEIIELKNYGHKGTVNWDSVMESVCAFLNTDGGIIILGIKEDDKSENKHYEVKGFNFNNESSLKEALKTFRDDADHPKDIMRLIQIEQREFMNQIIMIMFVDPLAYDERYVFYKGVAYQRIMQSDEHITQYEIEKQKEEKQDYINARELQPVPHATLDDLNIDKANFYINKSNEESQTINNLKSVEEAIPFYTFNGFYRDNKPTLLGMLVCGENLSHFLGFRSQVDAYVDIPGNLPQNKKVINDNVIPLLLESERFILRNIQTGLSLENGGTKTYEYPLELIRESSNNALAHRDYTIDKYVGINIVPFKHIEIRNPGRFKKQLLIPPDSKQEIQLRRIITNNAKPNNPKLAKVLNVFQKWEGKGRGMKNLVSSCLDGYIDLPYFIFHSPDELSLFIPKGKLVDERMEALIDSYSKYITEKLGGEELTEEQKRVFSYFYKSEVANKNEKWTLLLTKNNNHFNAINTLEDAGLIYKHPQSNEIYSIYITDRIFQKKNFYPELTEFFGNRFDELRQEQKEVLNAIYLHKKFSLKSKTTAYLISNYLFHKQHEGIFEKKEYDNYSRRIRNQFNKLEDANYLIPVKNITAKGNARTVDYLLNEKLKQTQTLFDAR